MRISVIGIDPGIGNTAVGYIGEDDKSPDGFHISTMHITGLLAGQYTRTIRLLADPKKHCEFNAGDNCGYTNPCYLKPMSEFVTAGFVENFDDVGGGDTTKATIRATSRAGGNAEEALAAMGVPMVPIKINEWRRVVLGNAPKHPTQKGLLRSYWTKGKNHVPGNLAPALLRLFKNRLGILIFLRPEKLFASKKNIPDDISKWDFDRCVDYVANKVPALTTRRIQLAFGKSLDELEAAAIALAGYRLIKSGQIEGL